MLDLQRDMFVRQMSCKIEAPLKHVSFEVPTVILIFCI